MIPSSGRRLLLLDPPRIIQSGASSLISPDVAVVLFWPLLLVLPPDDAVQGTPWPRHRIAASPRPGPGLCITASPRAPPLLCFTASPRPRPLGCCSASPRPLPLVWITASPRPCPHRPSMGSNTTPVQAGFWSMTLVLYPLYRRTPGDQMVACQIKNGCSISPKSPRAQIVVPQISIWSSATRTNPAVQIVAPRVSIWFSATRKSPRVQIVAPRTTIRSYTTQ